MNIVIAGIKRSGSTAQFNMVRLVLEHAGIDYSIIGHEMYLEDGNNLIKRHPFSKWLYGESNYIFTTDRDDAEIEESMARMGWDCNIDKMRRDLQLWQRKSVNMHFDEIRDCPLECIEIINLTLGLDVDCEAVLKEFKAIKPPKEGQDPVTLLFKDHVG